MGTQVAAWRRLSCAPAPPPTPCTTTWEKGEPTPVDIERAFPGITIDATPHRIRPEHPNPGETTDTMVPAATTSNHVDDIISIMDRWGINRMAADHSETDDDD